jgi:hypothetical protein
MIKAHSMKLLNLNDRFFGISFEQLLVVLIFFSLIILFSTVIRKNIT